MIKQCLAALAAVSVSFASSGCGNPAGLFPVSGKVLYKGEPASGAVVYFHRVGGSNCAESVNSVRRRRRQRQF